MEIHVPIQIENMLSEYSNLFLQTYSESEYKQDMKIRVYFSGECIEYSGALILNMEYTYLDTYVFTVKNDVFGFSSDVIDYEKLNYLEPTFIKFLCEECGSYVCVQEVWAIWHFKNIKVI